MTTTTLAALESYVLALDDAGRRSIREDLVEGSEAWYELSILEALEAGKAADKDTEELLSLYRLFSPGENADRLEFRRIFLAASAAPNGSSEQRQALKDIGENILRLRFNYPQISGRGPRALGGRGGGRTQEPSNSELPPQALPSTTDILERLYRGDPEVLNKGLPESCFQELDLCRLTDDRRLATFLASHRPQLPLLAGNPSLLTAVRGLVMRYKSQCGGVDWAPKEVLDLLTLEQLESLLEMEPSLRHDYSMVECLISRKFWDVLSTEAQNLMTRQQRRDSVLKVVAFIDTSCQPQHSHDVATSESMRLESSRSFDSEVGSVDYYSPDHGRKTTGSLQVRFLYEALHLGVQVALFDKELLLRYLREAPQHARLFSLPGFLCEDDCERQLCLAYTQQSAVRAHIQHFILEDDFVESVKPLLDESCRQTLRSLRDERALLTGRPLGHTDADSAWLQRMTGQARVELLPHNPSEFLPEEGVKLSVRLKNVPRLTVRIYEINAENYYVSNQKRFTSDINLEGVGASLEHEFTYGQPPVIEHDEDLEFPDLAGRCGLFVLDLVGSALRARAVIRKGTLSLIHKPSPAGHVAYVLGPDRGVVRRGARLYLGGRWYAGDEAAGGRIIVPYGKREEALDVVIAGLGTAQFSQFRRQAEAYELKACFCLLPESVIMGKKAKLLVCPRLLCCGRRCDPRLLRKAEVTVTMRTGDEGIPVVRSFPGLDLTDPEVSVEFLVPPRLRSLEAAFTAEVVNHTRGAAEPMAASRTWSVDDHADTDHLHELYLAHAADGYELRVLGKDGEAQEGVPCHVSLEGRLSVDAPPLTTDRTGAVRLGALPHVRSLRASACGVSRSWELLPAQGRLGISLPGQVDALEGEDVRLPCPYLYTKLEPHLVSLTELCGPDDQWLSRGWPEALSLEEASAGAGACGVLVLRGLRHGHYRLLFAGASGEPLRTVAVHIHKGRRWQGEGYVLRHDAILENRERPSALTITSTAVQPGAVTVGVAGVGAGTRLHVFGFHFLPPKLPELVSQLQDVNREAHAHVTFPFQQWQNLYQSGLSLGTESSYVLRRRKAESQVGNMMQKPHLLLQPREVRETVFAAEEMTCAAYADAQCMSYGAPMMQACMSSARCRSVSAMPEPCLEYRPTGDINSFQDFLDSEPFVALNLVPTAEGEVRVEADLSEFTSLLVVAADDRGVAHAVLPLEPRRPGPPASRGLALQSPLDAARACVEQRSAVALQPGESFGLTDQASAEWRAVDSVERLLAFFKAVNPGIAGPLDELGFGRWSGMEWPDKMDLWSKHACHELHLFVYFKDQAFFAKVVEPFLRSKMERDTVDAFLLGDRAALTPCLSPPRYHQLNPLEQVLVLRLLSAESPEKCKRLAQALAAQAEALGKARAGGHRNALLDSVLSLEPCRHVDEWEVVQQDFVAVPCSVGGSVGGKGFGGKGKAKGKGNAVFDNPFDRSNSLRCYSSEDSCDFDVDASQTEAIMAARAPEPWSEPETTKEYSETFYKEKEAGRFRPNAFWASAAMNAASAEPRGPLLSPDFVYATNCVTEAAAALALMELPFRAGEHSILPGQGLAASFVAESPCVLVAKEIVAVPAPAGDSARDLLVTVRVFKAKDNEDTSQDPRSIKEFLVNEPYCLQIVVTNVSPKTLGCQVLVQVPEGSLPLGRATYTHAYPQHLSAFACCRIAVHFYFPRPGTFAGAPVCCSVDGAVVATSGGVSYQVVQEPSHVEVKSFSDVLASGRPPASLPDPPTPFMGALQYSPTPHPYPRKPPPQN